MRYVDLTKAGCLMEVLAWRTIAWHARATWDADLVKALQQSTQSTTNRAGQRLVERNLNVQPTIGDNDAGR